MNIKCQSLLGRTIAGSMLVFSSTSFAQLGSSDNDFVYTPVDPCRIFDTRLTGFPINPATSQNFFVYGDGPTIAAQGGNAAGCQAPQGEPVAVHLNVTAVPSSNGFITVYPFGTSLPLASTLNYRNNVNIANAITAKTTFDIASPDISVFSNNQTHVLADVVGFYYPATTSHAFAGFDVFPGSSQLINSTSPENVTTDHLITPSITVEAGDDIFFSANVTINPNANGNVGLTMFPCIFAQSTAAPIAQAFDSFAHQVEACHTGVTTADYFVVPVSGIIQDVPAGTWEFSVCAQKSGSVPCTAEQNYNTYLQNMSVINLGK